MNTRRDTPHQPRLQGPQSQSALQVVQSFAAQHQERSLPPVHSQTCEELIQTAVISGRADFLNLAESEAYVVHWEPRIATLNDNFLSLFGACDQQQQQQQQPRNSRYNWTDCIELCSESRCDIVPDPYAPGGVLLQIVSPPYEILSLRIHNRNYGPDQTRIWFTAVMNAILRCQMRDQQMGKIPVTPKFRRAISINHMNPISTVPAGYNVTNMPPRQMVSSYGHPTSRPVTPTSAATTAVATSPASSFFATDHSVSFLTSPLSPRKSVTSSTVGESPTPSTLSQFSHAERKTIAIQTEEQLPPQNQQPQQQQHQKQQKLSFSQRFMNAAGRSLSFRTSFMSSSSRPAKFTDETVAEQTWKSTSSFATPIAAASTGSSMHRSKSAFYKLLARPSRQNVSSNVQPNAFEMGRSKTVNGDIGLRGAYSSPNIGAGDSIERSKLEEMYMAMRR